MSDDRAGWEWFAPPSNRDLPLASPAAVDAELAAAYARCFATSDGARVLRHLRAMTLERAMAPGAPGRVVRHLEGQRHLVLYVLALATRSRCGRHAPRTAEPSSITIDGNGDAE